MKQDLCLKYDFEIDVGNTYFRALEQVKMFLQKLKKKIERKGNNLKTPKFHQMLHAIDYITRHGSSINYYGLRGENFGKLKIKDDAKLTNKEKDILNFDISRRISEEDIVDHISTIYYQNNGRWALNYCNETDIMMNTNKLKQNISPIMKHKTKAYKRFLKLFSFM